MAKPQALLIVLEGGEKIMNKEKIITKECVLPITFFAGNDINKRMELVRGLLDEFPEGTPELEALGKLMKAGKIDITDMCFYRQLPTGFAGC